MSGFRRFIVDHPKRILALIAVLTVVLGALATRIEIDSSVESLLPDADPGKVYYEEIRALYGSEEIGVIGVIASDVYAAETLAKITRLTETIAALPEVERVVSLTNVRDPIADAIDPPLLVPDIPTTPEARENLRKKIAERPIFEGNLVSSDGRAAAINVFFRDSTGDEPAARRADEAILAVLERERGPEELHYTGIPHYKVYSAQVLWRDLSRFVPVTLAIIVIVLFVSFRSLRGVMLPAATVVLGLAWTLGLMVATGRRLSLGSVSLPPLVLVIGTAYALHVLAEYYELAKPGRAPREVAFEVLERIGTPAMIAAVTTVLGFLSIAANRISSIRDMGIYSAAGIAFAFVLAIVFVPACLALLPMPRHATEQDFSPRLSRALRRLCAGSMRRRREVIVLAGAIAALAIWPILHIRTDSNFQSFFREDDPVRQATDAINRHLVGSTAFYVTIDGTEPGIIQKFDTLERIRDLQRYVESLPGMEKTISFVDYVEAFDRGAQQVGAGDIVVGPDGEVVTGADGAVKTTFWENPPQLGGALQLIASNPKSFSSVVNADFSRTNVLVRTSLLRSSDVTGSAAAITDYARRHFPPELRVRATGSLILLTNTTGDIVSGQIESLVLTAGTIFVIMSAMFLSFRVGFIAMVPNLFPIVIFFGLMGLVGADLNLATNMIASIALGIAVDDTIHIMSRLSREVRETGEQSRALLDTVSSVGKPALYASSLLFFGFLVLCLSTFVPIQQFGFLSAATMLVALVGEMVLTPALLSTTRIITLWDLLTLKLGPDPHRTIGIFENLRGWQAKIVALMGELRSFPSGQMIVREGDVGDAMYVLIGGTADVVIHSGAETRAVRSLGRGDVFGEMALIRQAVRSADVVATSDVELMAMDQRFLARVERRYPRIALKILTNIAKILSDRLQDETRRAASVPRS